MARVIVVGAGVVGLSCAVRLVERGHLVSVVARDLPLETTSAVAAGLWHPPRADPAGRVTAWAATSYAELARLAAQDGTGVLMRSGTELVREPASRPWRSGAVPRPSPAADLPAGYAAGWELEAPVVEMPLYLGWLGRRVEELGGTVTRMALRALPDRAEVVVDAAGLGARLLADDASVVPVRGQVVHVEQVGLDRWWLDRAGRTYIVPRSSDVVIGATEEEGAWGCRPDPTVAEELLTRARRLVPQLRRAGVLGHRVGLRPARPRVRLEASPAAGGGQVVHCYGHGGGGVTLAWGCADEVASLVQ